MPAARATASIDTAWKPRCATIALVASSSCSRRSSACIRTGTAAMLHSCRLRAMDNFDVDIAIIGSGFSGLGMAIRLKRQGVEDFVVLERGDDVGGTWHYNTYPGCACDVPSHLYSFSFAPNAGWSRTYSRQPEIPDLERFRGPAFHSAQWDHGFDCAGKRVAVIGTGASAIQIVPAIAP